VTSVISSILSFLLFVGVSTLVLTLVVHIGLWLLTSLRRVKQRLGGQGIQDAATSRTIVRQVIPDSAGRPPPTFVDTHANHPATESTFEQAPLIQPQMNGRMVWHPSPTVDISPSAVLDEAWISTAIEAPHTVRQGKTLVLRVEVSNNHRCKRLRDESMLEVEYPSSVVQVVGSEPIELEPNGDTTLIYFQWTAPHLPGNYILRFIFLNYQVKTESVLVVN